MSYTHTLAVSLILIFSAIPAMSQAQKPKGTGKVGYSRLAGKGTPICRNLAMGGNDTKVGSTRALGEDCPPAKGAQ